MLTSAERTRRWREREAALNMPLDLCPVWQKHAQAADTQFPIKPLTVCETWLRAARYRDVNLISQRDVAKARKTWKKTFPAEKFGAMSLRRNASDVAN